MKTAGEGPPGHSIRQACHGITKCMVRPLPPAMAEWQIYELACRCSPISLHNCRAVTLAMTRHWCNLTQVHNRKCIWPSSILWCQRQPHGDAWSPLRNWISRVTGWFYLRSHCNINTVQERVVEVCMYSRRWQSEYNCTNVSVRARPHLIIEPASGWDDLGETLL